MQLNLNMFQKYINLKKKNDGKSKSSVTQRFYALNDITFTIS